MAGHSQDKQDKQFCTTSRSQDYGVCGRAAIFLVILACSTLAMAQNRNLQVARAAQNETEQRIALIIGNSSYSKNDSLPALKNATSDALDISAALKDHGFTKIIVLVDADYRKMREAITQFGDALKEAGSNAVGLFYYAGHGVQDSGKNYLIPIGARISGPKDLEFDTVDAARVLGYMEEADNRVNIMILDACRDNPFPVLNKFRSSAQSAGLAQMKAPTGSFVAFAAAEGQRASDGEGRNGLFTQHFLESLRHPDSNIDAVFTRVTAAVAEKTQKKQVPWRNSSLTSAFYFRPGQTGAGGGGGIDPAELARLDEQRRALEKDKALQEERSRREQARFEEERRSQQARFEEERRQSQARFAAEQARLEEQRRETQARLAAERQALELERQRQQREAQDTARRGTVNIPFTP